MRLPILLLAYLGIVFSACAQQPLILMTEAYPPFSYRDEDGGYRGVSVDQVRLIMKDINQPFTIEIVPWARAMALAETQTGRCVFAAARTAEREPHFKWVQPLFADRNVFIRRTGSAVSAANLEEAKRYVVGTYRAGYTEELLRRQGFPNIDVSADIETMLRKLFQDHIDLMPVSSSVFHKLKATGAALEKIMTFSEQQLAIACNKDVPDAVISNMQRSLDRIIAGGVQESIFKRYGVEQDD
jgi:polar amino acid transport system substrate-binding protein